jgi:myo-inositol-1(or 4)-monophosphatase
VCCIANHGIEDDVGLKLSSDGTIEACSMSPILGRIRYALEVAKAAISGFIPGAVESDHKSDGKGPVTEADRVANRVLHQSLLMDGEGWLSEESADDLSRLAKHHVWVVDPLDGTREFVEGIPEWCISVAFVEDGRAIAGGICNPITNEIFLGSAETGVTLNDRPVRTSERNFLAGAIVLASRSEVCREEWKRFDNQAFQVKPMGSVAYKLARVAAGLADATWTLSPKNEWDIAAGIAMVESAGGVVRTLEGNSVCLNQKSTLRSGLLASGANLMDEMQSYLEGHIRDALENHNSRHGR